MDISVIGCGYLGAVHAACMASLGHHVIGVERDPERAARLNRGDPVFFEPGFAEMLQSGLAAGRLHFTTDVGTVAGSRVHFLCVGTPQRADGDAADLDALHTAVNDLVPQLRPGDVVVGKSTVPVGTAQHLAALIRRADPDTALVWNPEFLREGTAVDDTLHPDRLVYGVCAEVGHADGEQTLDPVAVLDSVYADQLADNTPRMITDYATAELVKVAANSFLATKISFINAMADVCEATGADVHLLADAIGQDPRIGRQFFNAGLGFGGGCLPKDVRAFRVRAEELGATEPAAFLQQVDMINSRRPLAAADLAERMLDGRLAGRRIAVLGATFKPDSDDIRQSPGLATATLLQARGATVVVTDPEGTDNARKAHPDLDLTDDLELALTGADAVLVATDWAAFRELDPSWVAGLVSGRVIIDGRDILDRATWAAAGWTVATLGRPTLQFSPAVESAQVQNCRVGRVGLEPTTKRL